MTTPPAFPAVVHSYTDLLESLGEDRLSAAELARRTKRDVSNLRRDLPKLEDAGVLERLGALGGPATTQWALTDKGRMWVKGVAVAEGRVSVGPEAAELAAHLMQLVPDPDQPRKAFDDQALSDLADSIRDKGLLQPIVVRPAGPNRLHVIVAGERRYRALVRLAQAGDWPADRPVPIRIATPADEAEVMELALIENTQRADLNHMELAQGYRRLQDLGRTPKQIAAAVGRHNDHVTQHIRLTNLPADLHPLVADGRITFHDAKDLEAAIRAADADHADAAVADVLSGKLTARNAADSLRVAALPTGPHVVNGVDYFNASRAQEARYAAGIDKRPEPNHGGGRAAQPPAADNAEPAKAQAVDEGVTLSGRARLALVELAHKIAVDRRVVDPAAEVAWNPHDLTSYSAFAADIGTYWTDGAHAELAAQGLAIFATVKGGLPPMASLTSKGADWLDAKALTEGLPVSMAAVNSIRATMGHEGQGYATPWLAEVAQPAPDAAPTAQPTARIQGDLDEDPWGRSRDQIEADAEALREIQKLADLGFVEGGLADMEAFHTRGVTLVQVRDGYLDLCGPDGAVVASVVVDPNEDIPDSRADALSLLVARAINRVVTGASQ